MVEQDIFVPNMHLFMHGSQTISIEVDVLDWDPTGISLNLNDSMGYMPVIHEPTWIDKGHEIHYNPPPIIVPEPSSLVIILIGLVLVVFGRRKS